MSSLRAAEVSRAPLARASVALGRREVAPVAAVRLEVVERGAGLELGPLEVVAVGLVFELGVLLRAELDFVDDVERLGAELRTVLTCQDSAPAL